MRETSQVFKYYFLIFILFSCTHSPGEQDPLNEYEMIHDGRLHQYERYSSNTISLNGSWEVAEGDLDNIPVKFPHSSRIPGLLSNAVPSFEQLGIPSEKRKAFWYRKVFQLNKQVPPLVFLKIFKAKYGTAVYLNGNPVGTNTLSFTPSLFNITPFLNKKGAENEIIIRIGAHIESLPDTVVTGGEIEKFRYIPGIYDDVELILSENIVFNTVQVATDLDQNEVIIESKIFNYGKPEKINLEATIYNSQSGEMTGINKLNQMILNEGEGKKFRLVISVDNPEYWTPENPNLYHLVLKAGKEIYTTRFGFRTFRLDPNSTNTALLNNKPYFFRGTNIALFRFFEDPLCTDQPWNKEWVKALFLKFKSMGMNAARTCISVYPKFWYEIADEVGFALFAEYPIWYALKEGVSATDFDTEKSHPQRKYGIYPENLTTGRLIHEYSQWMQDLWNHASVVAWDAQNETWTPSTGEAIQAVKSLDLSQRPWDNGWSPPVSPDDYREAHQYFARYNVGNEDKTAFKRVQKPFILQDLSYLDKIPGTLYFPYQNAYKFSYNRYLNQPCILNEYGYLWLNRDGTPTTLTQPYYDAVLGKQATPEERRRHYAYMLAALTEYWRSVRTCFGVLHVFGLAYSIPGGATSDNFIDVDKLQLDPFFEDCLGDAFNPLGICIESWFIRMIPGRTCDVPVIITNDYNEAKEGTIEITLKKNNEIIGKEMVNFKIKALEQQRKWIRIQLPGEKGNYEMTASLQYGQTEIKSYRKINF